MAKLGEVCLLKAGKFVSANDISPEYNKGLYPCFGGNGIRGYVADYTHDGEFPLIGRQGALCGNVNLASGKFHATEHAVVVQPKIEMNVHWLYYALNAMNLGQYATGAAQPGLAVSKLETLSIEIPNISEQNKIAQTLYKVEQLVNFRKQQLAKLDELVKARFVEMFGERSSIRPQKLKEVTRRVKVGFVGTCEKYYTDNTGVPMLRTTNITSHGIDLKDLKYVTRTFHEKNLKSRVHKGDLLIARHGSNGQANVYCGDEAQCLNAIIIEPDHNITNPIFLENLINSRSVKRQIEKELVGSTQHVLNTTTLANVEVKIPAIKEQQVFAAFVERVDQQKQTVQQSLEKLELMKKALMQEYFG